QRTWHHVPLGCHEYVASVRLLSDPEGSHRTMRDIKFDRYAPTTLAVVDAQAAQQRLAGADRQMGRPIVPHLDDVVAEVERLQLRKRAAGPETVGDQHRQRRAQLVLASSG